MGSKMRDANKGPIGDVFGQVIRSIQITKCAMCGMYVPEATRVESAMTVYCSRRCVEARQRYSDLRRTFSEQRDEDGA